MATGFSVAVFLREKFYTKSALGGYYYVEAENFQILY